MYTNYPHLEVLDKFADAYVSFWITGWFWPYFVMGNADTWQKLGITMNGVRPICNNN